MANASSQLGQLKRAGIKTQRLVTDRKGKRLKMKASKIRESNHRFFTEKGSDEQSKEGQKGRVYLVTIIEEGLGNSKDKNYYSAEALQSGVQVFNGAKAYADHPDAITEKTLPERSMKDLVGWYSDCFVDKNPNTGKTRLRGKLHFFPSAKWLTDMIDVILTDPTAKNLFGISINAVGKTRPGNMGGEEVNYVEEFQRVDSADVVTEPAARGKFDKMLESRRGKVSLSMRARESSTLSPEKTKEVADSLVSAYNSDNPDEMKQSIFEAAKVLYADSSISGKGQGQANEEQYSNISPSGGGGQPEMKTKASRMKASAGNGTRRMVRKGKRLVAAAGTGSDNEDEGEPSPEDIESNLEEADVEDEESRSDMGEQSDFGGGSKYATVKASGRRGRRVASRSIEAFPNDMEEGLEDEGMEDEGLEGMEDEGMEDEMDAPGAGMAAGGGNAPGAGSGAMGAPAGGGAPGSSRTVASAEADDDDDMDYDDEDDDDEDNLDEADEEGSFDMRPNSVSESRSRSRRRFSREADSDSGQGAPIKKASYAGGLGHSGHSSLPKGADPTRGYEDSDEDFGREDSSTSGVGKSYKIKTSRFSRNRAQRRIAKPIVREANRRIEVLSREIVRLRESGHKKDRIINRTSGQLRFLESVRSANELLSKAVEQEILTKSSARSLRESLHGLNRDEQISEIKKLARFIEATSEGVEVRLTESVEGSGSRGGFAFRESAAVDSDELSVGLATDGVPMKRDR